MISGPETGNTCPFSQAVHPGKRSRRELPVCGIRDTASCHRSGDRHPFSARKKLQRRAAVARPPDSAEQSIQLESCSATPLTFRPSVRRRTERRTTLEKRHEERADSEEATDRTAGGQQSEDPKGVPRRNPRRCCAEGPYTSPEKEDPRPRRDQSVSKKRGAHRGGIQAARCPRCFQTAFQA